MENYKKSLLILTAISGLNFGAGLVIGNSNGLEEGFNLGRGHQMCLSDVKYELDSGDFSYAEYESRRNECDRKYNLTK